MKTSQYNVLKDKIVKMVMDKDRSPARQFLSLIAIQRRQMVANLYSLLRDLPCSTDICIFMHACIGQHFELGPSCVKRKKCLPQFGAATHGEAPSFDFVVANRSELDASHLKQ